MDFITEVGNKMEVPLKREDISVAHCVGKSSHGSRPVLVKFISRIHKTSSSRTEKNEGHN